MLRVLSKEEELKHKKELDEFIKDNRNHLYNYMRSIKGFREYGVIEERGRIIKVIENMRLNKKVKERLFKEIWKQPKKDLNKLYGKLGIIFPKIKKTKDKL